MTNSANHVNDQASDASEASSPESGVEAGPVSPEARSDDLSSSPYSGSSTVGSEDIPAQEDDASSDSDNDLDGESTAMSMDDATVRSNVTTHSNGSNTSSSARLDAALRQAAKEAGTRGIDYDENGELSMEIADQEITGAFQPWIKKGQRISFDMEDLSALHDQENLDPFRQQTEGQDSQPTASDSENDDEDLSMDITNAVGRILAKHTGRRQSVRRKSSGQETNYDDQTMEFTNVVGGIAQPAQIVSPAKSTGAESNVDEDEEMTMEFTSVIGGVLNNKSLSNSHPRDENLYPNLDNRPELNRKLSDLGDGEDEDGMEMDITSAVGGILPRTEKQDESHDDYTAAMDLTTTTGRIYPTLEQSDRIRGKVLMETETDAGQLGSSPFRERPPTSPQKFIESHHVAPVASESGSPSLASVRARPTRGSIGRRTSRASVSHSPQATPVRKVTTPSKQLTPQPPLRPSTPSKTPPSAKVAWRSASPQKLFQPELQSANKSQSPRRKSLFERDTKTGETTPAFVLRPHERRSSGLGIDRAGLGSPRVAEMLDKRRSIGEDAQQFVPQQQLARGVRFDDPVRLQEEVDREREEEEYREDGHIYPTKAGERDVTTSLKDMISSLTPKKNKIAGRKSLHVGAARGLLGKRPAELDQSDEEEDNSPKRIRGREASPVKNIRLPAPPTKDETLRSSAFKIGDLSPAKNSTTPKDAPRFKDAMVSFVGTKVPSEPEPRVDLEEDNDGEPAEPEFEPIQLQDFLNMTNIHFMELTTTKRRHTIAPGSDKEEAKSTGKGDSGDGNISLEDCVAAGFCTVPMLELYQHVSSALN